MRRSTCALYAAGSGGTGRMCRRLLQYQQAATMFRALVPPPAERATRCSAVHIRIRSARLNAGDAASIVTPQYQQHQSCRRAAESRSFTSLLVSITQPSSIAARTIRAIVEADVQRGFLPASVLRGYPRTRRRQWTPLRSNNIEYTSMDDVSQPALFSKFANIDERHLPGSTAQAAT